MVEAPVEVEVPVAGRSDDYADLFAVREALIVRGSGDYPVQFVVNDERAESRFWGHPLLGVMVRAVALVPHVLAMLVFGAIGLLWLVVVGWIPILLRKRVPVIQADIYEELIHRGSRMGAYMCLLPGYPPLGIGRPGPVDVRFNLEGRTMSRWWGIPIIGLCARQIALVPHFVVLFALGFYVGLVWLIVWIPIFVNARIPNLAVRIFGSYLRYWARVMSYAFLLPVPYPPFAIK
jgi:hypothetical protein